MPRAIPEGPWPRVKTTYLALRTKLAQVDAEIRDKAKAKATKAAIIDYWTGLLLLERSEL